MLLWMVFLNGLHISVSHGPGLNFGDDYEVVRPVRLHSINKRQAENYRPQKVKYALTVGGQPVEMDLERNNELLTKNYSETHYLENGTAVTTTPENIDHCYYRGKIVGDSESEASISICDGLSGLGYVLVSELCGFECVVLPLGQIGFFQISTTGPRTWSRSAAGDPLSGQSIVFDQKFVELYLVADNREYLRMGKDISKLRTRMLKVVNFVSMVYKPLQTVVTLVGLEIWTDSDKIVITSDSEKSLNNFKNWRNNNLLNKKHDSAHLISGIDFDGDTVGLAYVGALCTGYSVGVVQDYTDPSAAIGATLAHELGHNLGMSHDTSACECSGDSCIMEPSINLPRTFSSCSRSFYEKFLLDKSVHCLLNKPDFQTLVSQRQQFAVCGNGFLEEGEQCDCGSVKECTNRCCNASTCMFSEGSQCADGECCDDCKILGRSHECRSTKDECDLAEYCDGVSAICPEDVFTVNGAPCDNGQGFCYNGQCPQRASQCTKMFGPGATEAHSGCYNQNTKGTYYGFCKRPASDQYIPCQTQDILCGKLFCQGGNASPNYGRMVTVGDCKATSYDDFTKDFGQVDTGTVCGDGKVCSDNECVDLETAYRNTNCSAKCPGHAVCNHRSQCQCEPGWMPPNCDTKDGEFTPISTGVIVGICIAVFLVLLGIIAGILFFICKKRQVPVSPITHTKPYLTQKPVQASPTLAVKEKPKGVRRQQNYTAVSQIRKRQGVSPEQQQQQQRQRQRQR
ncbi:hypothetical protein WMY93_004000 [Mugilogobius chulae]|uniref:Uncharacterized protein n=1 Tax=Mugilogobius chulae TaxID=88201 RepID=A0AAW0PPZ1_9GOBI